MEQSDNPNYDFWALRNLGDRFSHGEKYIIEKRSRVRNGTFDIREVLKMVCGGRCGIELQL